MCEKVSECEATAILNNYKIKNATRCYFHRNFPVAHATYIRERVMLEYNVHKTSDQKLVALVEEI